MSAFATWHKNNVSLTVSSGDWKDGAAADLGSPGFMTFQVAPPSCWFDLGSDPSPGGD